MVNCNARKHIVSHNGKTSVTISRTLERHILGNPHAFFNADHQDLQILLLRRAGGSI